jgi:hypothetical protein
MTLRIEAIRWRSSKWEFREATLGYRWMTIEDEEFLQRVDERDEQFEKGDILDCLVRVRQWDEGDGDYRTDYSIVSVLEHRPSDQGRQLTIYRTEPPRVERGGPYASLGDGDSDSEEEE